MITTIKFQNLKMLFILVDKTVAFQISRISEIVEKIERSLLYKIICVTSRGIQAYQNTTRYKNSRFFVFLFLFLLGQLFRNHANVINQVLLTTGDTLLIDIN